jgi:hypothetical protein
MVCYIVPLAATLVLGGLRKAGISKGVHGFWLNIMMLGGALFGAVDHLWNGELFMAGVNWMSDIALGFTITGSIFAGWGAIVYKEQLIQPFRFMGRRIGIIGKI